MIPHWRVDIMRKVLSTVEACWRAGGIGYGVVVRRITERSEVQLGRCR